jgi:DNA-binding NtrC family response regulator
VTQLNLLITDDNPDDAWLVAYAVKRAGYTIEWRRVDDEPGFALEIGFADLVLCDFSMPRFSPVRALEMIREHGLVTPLVLVSGTVSADCANQILRLGAIGYVLKDQLENLPPIIATALAGRSIEPARRTSPIPVIEHAIHGAAPPRTRR